jgi:hypothetical protein
VSGQLVDYALNVLLPLEINEQYLKRDMWQPSMGLACSDQTLGLCSVVQTDASGHPEAGSSDNLTALFFGDAYK